MWQQEHSNEIECGNTGPKKCSGGTIALGSLVGQIFNRMLANRDDSRLRANRITIAGGALAGLTGSVKSDTLSSSFWMWIAEALVRTMLHGYGLLSAAVWGN